MKSYLYHVSFLVILVKVLFINGQCSENYKKYINVKSSNTTECVRVNNYIFICPSLEKALEKDLNFTCIKIFTASENLTKRNILINVHSLTIANAYTHSPIFITCKTNHSSKISFIDSSNINIYRLAFNSCGGTDQNDFLIANSTKINLSSVLYLRNVTGLIINGTYFWGSRGYSIIMAEVVNAYYHKVHFSSNKVVPFLDEENLSYGGGVLTFLSDSKSGEVNTLKISDCQFYFINATDSAKTQYSLTQGQDDAISDLFKKTFLGKGGGLSFYLQSQNLSTNISIKSSNVFYHNRAFWGGGIYMEIGQYVHRNHIEINDARFVDNFANFSGGAIKIMRNAKNNSVVHLSYSLFTGNEAEFGGGLTLISSLKFLESIFHTNQETKIIYCEFTRNVVTLGSAIYLSRTSVLLHMLNITENTFSLFFKGPPLTTVMGIGALYSYKSHVVINGTLETPSRVSGNLNTGLVLDYSHLYVLGTVLFEKNQGSKGGAISMYELSSIFLFDTTHLTFYRNSAVKGGAIYVYLTSPPFHKWNSRELFVYKCFFRYHHTSIGSFKGSVLFDNNIAARNDGSAIFANTLQGCQDSFSHKFSGISFQGNNDSYITTDPVNIKVNKTQWENVSPGIQFSANIYLTDEMEYNVDAAIEITFEPKEKVSIKDNKNRMIVTNNTVELVILGDCNANFNVTIRTPKGRALPLKIVNKNLKGCPFAYSYSSTTKSCDCLNVKRQDRMISRCVGNDIYLYKGVWAYPYRSSMHTDDETTQVCPRGYCNQSCSENSVDCKYDPRYQCAENRDQSLSNYLCAKCARNYSVAFGSEKCIDCRGKSKLWTPLLILFAVPAFVVLVLWINIDIYKWLLNSLIFYYQVVHLLLTPEQDTDVVVRFIMRVVDLRDVGLGFCVYDGLNDLDKIMFSYLIPSMMILTLILIIIFTEKCTCTLPCEQVNTFRAILFVLVIPYQAIISITLDILKIVEIDGVYRVANFAVLMYMEGDHLYYSIVAFIFLTVFVVGLPLLLVIPNTICTKYRFYMSFFKPLLEGFLSVFQNSLICHLFCAFYFLFRLILLLMSTFMKRDQFQVTIMAFFCFIMSLLFFKVRPYRSNISNYFDMSILCNLTIIAFISNSKLSLPLRDNISVNKVVMVLLWLPLVSWLITVVWSHWETIQKKFCQCALTSVIVTQH